MMNIDLFFSPFSLFLLLPPPSVRSAKYYYYSFLFSFRVLFEGGSPSVSGNISLQHSLLRIKKYVLYVSDEAPPESLNQGMRVYVEEGGRGETGAKMVFLFFRLRF